MANVVPSRLIIVTPMMEEQLFSESSDVTRATRRNIAEDFTPHSHLRENLKYSRTSLHKNYGP
jgi:hypothetical protein